MSSDAKCPGDWATLSDVRVRRFENNPIITPEMLPGSDGANINGPSLLRVPDCVRSPLGRYYLYFSHHGGKYIRLAYADDLAGQWRVYEPGVLHMDSLGVNFSHIASPDILYDEQTGKLRMYFHGHEVGMTGQYSYVAISNDGLNFEMLPDRLGIFYFRVFRYGSRWYAVAKAGQLYGSDDGLQFSEMHNIFDAMPEMSATGCSGRHFAVDIVGTTLWLYYTNIGDAPERVLRAACDLTVPPPEWLAREPREILRPQTAWEGADLPVEVSKGGACVRSHAMRDPCIFNENAKKYLLYSVAGECGIAIAELL